MAGPPADTTFSPLDWFLVVVLVVSTATAFARGIIRVLLSLGGLIVGILAASWSYILVAERVHAWIGNFVACQVLGFLLVFGLVLLCVNLVAAALSQTVKAVGLGFVDRMLGGGFGFVRGGLIGVVVLMVGTAFFPDSPVVQKSVLAPYFLDGFHAVSFVVPAHFQEQITVGAKELLHETPELLRPHPSMQHVD